MKMLGDGAFGSRRRYLAEQAIFMEETFGKAASSPMKAVGESLRPASGRQDDAGRIARLRAEIVLGEKHGGIHPERQLMRRYRATGEPNPRHFIGPRLAQRIDSYKARGISKAAGFTTPITKPVASFKAPAAGGGASKPKVASLKPTGGALPSASQRLSALRQNLATTGPSSTPPAAAGAGTVGKSLRLRRRGRFQRQGASSPVALLSREKMQGTPAEPLAVFTKALKIVGGTRGTRHTFIPMGGKHGGTRGIPQLHPDDLAEAKRQAATLKNSAGQPRWMVQHEVEEAGAKNAKARGGKEYRMSDKPTKPGPYDRAFLGAGVLGYRGSNTRLGRGYGISKALKVTGVRLHPHDIGGISMGGWHPDDLDQAEKLASRLKNSAGKPRHMLQHETRTAAMENLVFPSAKEQAANPRLKEAVRNRRKVERGAFGKREPLKTSISEDDARKLVDRHGLKGPLPKELNREQRMAAYEARYVSAGGKKAERWDHRAHMADKVKTGGLAIATAGGAGWLATRGRLKGKALSPRIRHHAETIAGAGATAGGAGELYAGHARRKRSSYASTPAGVAASALRRMQDYS